jgi:hypothetical protein
VKVPLRQEGADASVLPRAYQDLLEVAGDAGRPLRAAEFAAATGLSTAKAKVEGLRSKLRLLAERGWLATTSCAMTRPSRPAGRSPPGSSREHAATSSLTAST